MANRKKIIHSNNLQNSILAAGTHIREGSGIKAAIKIDKQRVTRAKSIRLEAAQMGRHVSSGNSLPSLLMSPSFLSPQGVRTRNKVNHGKRPMSIINNLSMFSISEGNTSNNEEKKFSIDLTQKKKTKRKKLPAQRFGSIRVPRARLIRGHRPSAMAISENHKLVRQLKLNNNVRKLCIVNETLWEASRNGSIYLRNVKTGETYKALSNKNNDKVYLNGIQHQLKTVWTGDSRGTIRGYSESGGRILCSFNRGAQAGVKDLLALTKMDPHVFWIAGEDWNVSVHQSAGGNFVRKLGGHKGWVSCLCLDHYHRRLWSGGEDGVRIWEREHILLHATSPVTVHTDVTEQKSLCFKVLPKTNGVTTLCASKNQVWAGFQDAHIKIWRSSDYKLLHRFKAHQKVVSTIKVVGNEVFSASMLTNCVKIWSNKDGENLPELLSTLSVPLKSKIVDIVPFGNYVWFGGRAPGALFLYSIPKQSFFNNETDGDSRAFLLWANNVLSNSKYKNLELDESKAFTSQMTDGIVYAALLDTLGGSKLGVQLPHVTPKNVSQKKENAQHIIDIMKKARMQIPETVTAESIIGNRQKDILDLVWEMIRKYHIQLGYSDNQTTEAMLEWVNKTIAPAVEQEDVDMVTNFDWGWYDGYALSALVDQKEIGCIAFGKLDRNDPEWNVETAMSTASTFDIPDLIDAGDMVFKPCPRSIMTYVAFFRESDKKSADPLISYVRGPSSGEGKKEFDSPNDWATASTKKLWTPENKNNIEQPSCVEFTVFAKDTDGAPVINSTIDVLMKGPDGAVEVKINDNEDGTFTCRYAYPLPPGDYTLDCKLDGNTIRHNNRAEIVRRSTIFLNQTNLLEAHPLSFTVKKSVDPSKSYSEGPGITGGIIIEKPKYIDAAEESSSDSEDEAVASEFLINRDPSKAFVEMHAEDDIRESAREKNKKDEGMGLGTFNVYSVDEDEQPVFGAYCEVEMIGPDGPIFVEVKDNGYGIFQAKYETPLVPGDYNISVKLDGQEVSNSPSEFTIKRVADPSHCYAKGAGLLGPDHLTEEKDNLSFVVYVFDKDDEVVQESEAEVIITNLQGASFKTNITSEGNGKYTVSYNPNDVLPGNYSVDCLINGKSINQSPYTFNVRKKADPSKSNLNGPGLTADGCENGLGAFMIFPRDDDGHPVLGAKCEISMNGPNGLIPLQVEDCGENVAVNYEAPLPPGDYIINCILDGKPLDRPPPTFTIKKKALASACFAEGPGIAQRRPTHPTNTNDDVLDIGLDWTRFTVHALDEDSNKVIDANIEVKMTKISGKNNELSTPIDVQVVDRGDGIFDCSYTNALEPDGELPPGSYVIWVTVNGEGVYGMPIRLNIPERADPSFTHASGPGLEGHKIGSGRSHFAIFAKDCHGNPVFLPPEKLNIEIRDSSNKNVIESKIFTQPKTNTTEEKNDIITHCVFYDPTLPGKYTINVLTDEYSIQKMPVVVDLKKGASGAATVDMHCQITIIAQDENGDVKTEGGDEFDVMIHDEDGKITETKNVDKEDGTYYTEFVLNNTVLYTTSLKFNGQEMGISPLINDLRNEIDKHKDDAIVVYDIDNIF